jgi:hypothetical protein
MVSQLHYGDVPLYECNAHAIEVKGVGPDGLDWNQLDPDRAL